MKKFLLFTLMTLFCVTLFAEKVYRSDGTFFEMKRNGSVFALKTNAASLKAPENYKMKWRAGDEFIVIDKKINGNLPVYLVGANMYVADSKLFYRGTKSIEFIEKKYNIKVVELVNGYDYVEFDGAADSVKTAQQIVENGDGFAFPNLYRRYELKSNPVKFPIEDKYYTEGYQWSLKNTGKGKGYEIAGNAYKAKEMDILKHADIRFEEAMEFLYNEIEAGNLEKFDETTKVAIMDSGVDFEHPDLKNKLEDGFNMVHEGETGNPGEYDPNDPMSSIYGASGYSHGTNCAGVAAAEGNEIGTVGICPWCGIYPVTFMEGGMGTEESASDEKLMEVYKKYTADPEIVAINCSFGPSATMGYVPATQGEIDSHKLFMEKGRNKKGGVIVYASGNDGIDAAYTGILSYEFKMKRNDKDVTSKVVTVGASSAWDTRVTYSNYGDMLDIVAPSLSMQPLIGIATSYLTGYGDMEDKDYTNMFSGTSSATPVITGAFGVIFSVNPDLTLEEAVEILHKSADKVNPETGFYDKNGHSIKYGYGRLNLLKAVRLAMGKEMCEGKADETADNIDNNCDGKVDEGLNKDISKVTAGCKAAKDCETADFKGENVKCVTGEYKKYKFEDGYCTIKNDNFTCPDGTAPYSDDDSECFLECNKANPCPKGFGCTDEKLGLCFPECESNEDCADNGRVYCDTDLKLCKNIQSEPLGECESNEDCKYGAECMAQLPGGVCFIMCNDDEQCGDGGSKCAEITTPFAPMNLCVPACKEDSDCRSFGGFMRLVCHENFQGKGAICGTECEEDYDCVSDINDKSTKCIDSRCVIEGGNDPDEPTDTDENNDNELSDETVDDSDDDMTFEDDKPSDKKKSSGCALTNL